MNQEKEDYAKTGSRDLMREKYWSEIQEHEKIERMRQQVHNLQESLDRVMTLIQKVTRHNHVNDKVVIIEDLDGLEQGYGYEQRAMTRKHSENPDDVYF